MKTLRHNNLDTLNPHGIATLGNRANMMRRLKTKARNEQRLRIWKQSPHCALCGGLVAFEAMELDHIVPLSDGGTNDDSNVQPLHPACHRQKTSDEIRQRGRAARRNITGG